MEIPVTLVPSIDAQAWPNEIYVGYATGWMRRYDQEFDPDQPARILSTDKKAQKAGGLCLALKGVPVKPTDDVDVDKEYQLIPLDSL